MAPLQHSSAELRFVPVYTEVGSQFYTANGEWELSSSRVMTFDKDVAIELLPIVKVTFYFKRRPAFILVNIILPVVLLMFLNILVFLIPVELGEKISYGITVQLALALFLSVVSEKLPNVSDKIPILMMYLYTINFLSVLTVIASIVVVFLHKIETDSKDEEDKTTNTSNKSTLVMGTRLSGNSVNPVGLSDCLMEDVRSCDSSRMSNSSLNSSENKTTNTSKKTTLVKGTRPPRNSVTPVGLADCLMEDVRTGESFSRLSSSSLNPPALSNRSKHRKQLCQWFKCSSRSRCINLVSLYVFLFVWCVLTVGFLLQASRSMKMK